MNAWGVKLIGSGSYVSRYLRVRNSGLVVTKLGRSGAPIASSLDWISMSLLKTSTKR